VRTRAPLEQRPLSEVSSLRTTPRRTAHQELVRERSRLSTSQQCNGRAPRPLLLVHSLAENVRCEDLVEGLLLYVLSVVKSYLMRHFQRTLTETNLSSDARLSGIWSLYTLRVNHVSRGCP
jgi:hypothetical protein